MTSVGFSFSSRRRRGFLAAVVLGLAASGFVVLGGKPDAAGVSTAPAHAEHE